MGNKENVRLSGNIREQALQLIKIIKDRELTSEQLEKLLPSVKGFYVEVCDILKEEIHAGKECNINAIKSLQSVLDGLVNKLHTEVTPAEKKELLNVILEISNHIKEIEMNRENKAVGFKKFIASLLAIVMLVVVILSGGKLGKNKTNS